MLPYGYLSHLHVFLVISPSLFDSWNCLNCSIWFLWKYSIGTQFWRKKTPNILMENEKCVAVTKGRLQSNAAIANTALFNILVISTITWLQWIKSMILSMLNRVFTAMDHDSLFVLNCVDFMMFVIAALCEDLRTSFGASDSYTYQDNMYVTWLAISHFITFH